MRSILLMIPLFLATGVGCSKEAPRNAERAAMRPAADGKGEAPAFKVGGQAQPEEPNVHGNFIVHQDGKKEAPPEEKKEKPRKIRYTADMKLIVKTIDEAEEALDAARKEAKGDYEKAEVNRSVNTVRTGTWRIRVPNENLNTFRKAVAKIGDVERDTIESEDMTAKYYDLDAHITNRKVEQKAIREFLTEIGKKDVRYLEVKRELDAITDDIMRKEGMLKLWTNLTDLTTFTVHMREKQVNDPPPPPSIEPPPAPFGERVNKTWTSSWDLFLGFCQGVALIAIAVAPWLPIPLVFFGTLALIARRIARNSKKPIVVETKPAS